MSKDTIYRQVAIEALEAKKDKSAKGDMGCFYNTIIQNDIDALKGLPSAQPEQRWIPVTERLPNDDTEVIVSCTDDSGDGKFSYVTTGWHFKGMWIVNNERCFFVRAWQPLPEKPYREEGHDD